MSSNKNNIFFFFGCQAAGGKSLATSEALVVGGLTRIAAGTLLIPVTVVKTRWEARGADRQEGLANALRGLAKGEGLKGLAAGLVPTLLRDAPYSGLYLASFTTLRNLLPDQESAVQGDRVAAALLAGLAATTMVGRTQTILSRAATSLLLKGPPCRCDENTITASRS